jgi:hypothetical protein
MHRTMCVGLKFNQKNYGMLEVVNETHACMQGTEKAICSEVEEATNGEGERREILRDNQKKNYCATKRAAEGIFQT